MERADGGDISPLGEKIARAIYDNINRFVLPAVAGEARLVPLASLVDRDFTLATLRQAAQRGRLKAIQAPDGTWQSTRDDVNDYRRSKASTSSKAG